MNLQYTLNSLEALACIAHQSYASNGKLECIESESVDSGRYRLLKTSKNDKNKASFETVSDICHKIYAQVLENQASHNEPEYTTARLAFKCIHKRLMREIHLNKIQRTLAYLSPSYRRRKEVELQPYLELALFIEQKILSKYPKVNAADIRTAEQAHLKFALDFDQQLGVQPRALDRGETLLVDAVSQRIWESGNVQDITKEEAEKQTSKKYERYVDIMANEFFRGSHMLFVTEPGKASLAKTLIDSINESMNETGQRELIPPSNAPLGRIQERITSHYRPCRERGQDNRQYHLQGSQLPEIIFAEESFAVKQSEKEPGVLLVKTGRYYGQDKDENADNDCQQKKFTWLQSERTPLGPTWRNWAKHGLVDFMLYLFAKHVRRKVNCNIGPYGNGRSDQHPLIIYEKGAPIKELEKQVEACC